MYGALLEGLMFTSYLANGINPQRILVEELNS